MILFIKNQKGKSFSRKLRRKNDGKNKKCWGEAKLAAEDKLGKAISLFLLMLLVEFVAGPTLFWWLEERKKKNRK